MKIDAKPTNVCCRTLALAAYLLLLSGSAATSAENSAQKRFFFLEHCRGAEKLTCQFVCARGVCVRPCLCLCVCGVWSTGTLFASNNLIALYLLSHCLTKNITTHARTWARRWKNCRFGRVRSGCLFESGNFYLHNSRYYAFRAAACMSIKCQSPLFSVSLVFRKWFLVIHCRHHSKMNVNCIHGQHLCARRLPVFISCFYPFTNFCIFSIEMAEHFTDAHTHTWHTSTIINIIRTNARY